MKTFDNPGELYRAIARGHYTDQDGFDLFKNRFKFAFRTLLARKETLAWLGTFCTGPDLPALLARHPRLAVKLHRPYLHLQLGDPGKLAILQAHYALEPALFAGASKRELLETDGLDLARITGKDERVFTIRLTHAHSFDKEGELALQLIDPDHIELTQITLTFNQGTEGPELLIGGLQGPRKYHGHECIRTATKSFHGLFPKRVAMEAVVALAGHLGLRRVRAVSKTLHIYNSWRYRKHFEADYDAFWETLEATLAADQFYDIPRPIPRKAMEDIASKKRAEYQRRYTLLDTLGSDIATTLARP